MNTPASKKILICDIDESTRASLKFILSDHYDLILTDSPEQGLECLNHDNTIDLVLLAAQMPKVNGTKTALEAIKEKKPNLNVIIISPRELPEIPADASGAISKPFKTDTILDKIKEKMG